MHRPGPAALIRWILAVSSPMAFLSTPGTNGILHDVLLSDGLGWLVSVFPLLELLTTLALALSAGSRFLPIRWFGLEEARFKAFLCRNSLTCL